MRIIAISGWKRSGKDTLASHLVEAYGYKQISFARPLKDSVSEQFDIERWMIDDQKVKESPILSMPVYAKDAFSEMLVKFMWKELRREDGLQAEFMQIEPTTNRAYGLIVDKPVSPMYWTPRALCILEGSTKRAASPDYWVSKAIKTANEINPNATYIISDLRYRSEIQGIKDALSQKDQLITVRINRFDDSPSSDPSERDLDNADFDIVIANKNMSISHFLEIGSSRINDKLKDFL